MNRKTWELLKKIKMQDKKSSDDKLKFWTREFKSQQSDDTLLRNRFKELQREGMINVFWADDLPEYITLTEKGVSYCFLKEKAIKILPFLKLLMK